MTGKIVWLASYPKSGNTWFRLFLTALLNDLDEIDINAPAVSKIASARNWFDSVAGYDTGDLSPEEIDRMRPDVYRYSAGMYTERHYHKVHDAYVCNDAGEPLFPAEITDRVVYLVRNPFDVCISFCHHGGHDRYDEMLLKMGDHGFCLAGDRNKQADQVRQRLLSWQEHVRSWTEASGLPVFIMPYESMCLDPLPIFRQSVRFLGLEYDDAAILRALEICAFDRLQAQEKEIGFREKWPASDRFFHTGKIGSWHGKLNAELVTAFIQTSHEILQKMGYIDSNGKLVY